MDRNTLYYTLSAIPQVLAAIAAIIGAFIHFRIMSLKDLLIGDGKSVLNRWGDIGYKFSDKDLDLKYKKRLKDAIDRKNITGIKNVIQLLSDIEKNEGYTKEDRPTGLQYLLEDRFCSTENHIKKLKQLTLYIIGFSIFTIILSIVSLGLMDFLFSSICTSLKYIALWMNIIFFIFSIILAFYLMYLGFSEKTLHETYRIK